MIRYFLASTALIGTAVLSVNVYAQPQKSTPQLKTPQLEISGNSSFNSWFFDNKRKTVAGDKENHPWKRQKFDRTNLFTVNDARLRFAVNGKTDPGMDYGLVIVLEGNGDASKSVREDYLYFGGTWGKTQFGNTYGVQNTMAFGGFDQWGGTGFIEGQNYKKVVNETTGAAADVNLVGDTSRDTKATYLTPRWKGVQAGVSYTPRTKKHRGDQQVNSILSSESPLEPFDTENIASGINFIHKFTSGFEMALSGTSIFAKEHPEYHGAPKRKNIRSFAFGGTFSYADVGFSAEYGNNDRSRTFKEGGRKSNAGQFIDFGLSYKWGATKFSTGYYYGWRNALGGGINSHFKRRKSKTNAVAAAIDHKLAPGLGVYLEYAYFQMKNPAAKAEAARVNAVLSGPGQFIGPVKNNNANAVVIGSRLVF